MPKQSGSHSVSDYNELISKLLTAMPHEEAMLLAGGGNFLSFGILQRNILLRNGLDPNGYLIDIGCGSGRTAYALRTLPGLRYLGTDVVASLLSYATTACAREDWRFVCTAGLEIPEADGVADMICAFSLFTHLLHEETYTYLAAAFRVLKPGGIVIFSFLDFSIPAHWAVFQTNLDTIGSSVHLNQFMDPTAIHIWARHLGYEVRAIYGGNEEYAELDEPITLDDGRVLADRASLGQSLAILRKPSANTTSA